MKKAIWNDVVIAESETTVQIEGNHYFPPSSLKKEYFKESELKSTCAWKGVASYFNLEVNGKINENAAWYYPEVSELAKGIKGHIAFWRGVKVTE